MAVPIAARRFGAPALRAAVLCCALLALAACGGQRPHTAGGWQQPASYDPPGPPSDPWGPWIRQASQRFDVPEAWIREVMRQESGGRPNVTSRAGAMGLMQVMPGTYRELQARYGLGPDPYHPWNNIMAGTAYIREMYDLYGNPGFLAAYNAGPRRFEDYLWGGRGLPGETRTYVARIAPRIAGISPARRAPPEIYAAAEIPFDIPPGPRPGDRAVMLALRDQRSPPPPIREGAPEVQTAGLPRGVVVAMEPIEDGRPVPAPALAGRAVALADPPSEPPRAAPAPAPAGPPAASGTAREPSPRLLAAALPPPAAPMPASPPAAGRRGSALAAARPGVVPPPAARPVALPPRPAAQPEPPPMALAAAAPPPRLGLIGSAQAATLPRPGTPAPTAPAAPARPAGTGGAWGVQVGAFASENLARAAAAAARDQVALLGARPVVVPVRQGRETLYRARVIGLSREAAMAACQRLGGRGGCIVVSPEG